MEKTKECAMGGGKVVWRLHLLLCNSELISELMITEANLHESKKKGKELL